MLRKTFAILILSSAFWSCKDQTPDLPTFTLPEPKPSIHIIDNDLFFQFTWGKKADTMTFEVLNDTTTWGDTNFVNLVGDERNEEIFDTSGSSVMILEEFNKIGWHYAPYSILITKEYRDLLIAYNDPTIFVDAFTLDRAARNIVKLAFPFSTRDTLAFWDIQDYIDNPSLRVDMIRWGRVGNNKLNDTIWNNDAQPGAVVSYTDTAGVEWRSDLPPTFQPFGYFRITAVTPNLKDNQSYNLVEGDFAVRLYNKDRDYKDMKNGKFKLRIVSDIDLGPEPQ